MIVRFTELGAAAFWKMICNPSRAGLEPADWYRPESPTEEIEVAKLHKFADTQLCTTKKVNVTDQAGQEHTVDEKEFTGGLFSLRKDLRNRAEKIIDHYRTKSKKGKGRFLAISLAELEAGINNKDMPTDDDQLDLEDPDDVAELAALRAKALPEPAAKE